MADDDNQTAGVADDQPVVDQPAADAAAPSSAASTTGTDQHGRQLYDVTCSSCGNKAQVPFKPSGDRPVFCRDCYMQRRNK